jgi:hypothetical protein
MPKENRSILADAQVKLRIFIARRDYSAKILKEFDKRNEELDARIEGIQAEKRKLRETFKSAPSILVEYGEKIRKQTAVVNSMHDEKHITGWSKKAVPIYATSRVERLVRLKRRLRKASIELIEEEAEAKSRKVLWEEGYDVGPFRIAKKNSKWFWFTRGQKGQVFGPFSSDTEARLDATTESEASE